MNNKTPDFEKAPRFFHHFVPKEDDYYRDEENRQKNLEARKEYLSSEPTIYVGGTECAIEYLQDHPEIWGVVALDYEIQESDRERYMKASDNLDLQVHLAPIQDWDERSRHLGLRLRTQDVKEKYCPKESDVNAVVNFLQRWASQEPLPSLVVHCGAGIARSTVFGLAAHTLISNSPKESVNALLEADNGRFTKMLTDPNWEIAKIVDKRLGFNGYFEESEAEYFLDWELQITGKSSIIDRECAWCKDHAFSFKKVHNGGETYRQLCESGIPLRTWINALSALVVLQANDRAIGPASLAEALDVSSNSATTVLSRLEQCAGDRRRLLRIISNRPKVRDLAVWLFGSDHLQSCKLGELDQDISLSDSAE